MTLNELIQKLQEIRSHHLGDLEVFYLVHTDAPPVTIDKVKFTKADITGEDFGYKEGQPYILISNDDVW